MREIILDTETTGLNFHQGDQIIEVGCVELINHVATNKQIHIITESSKSTEHIH